MSSAWENFFAATAMLASAGPIKHRLAEAYRTHLANVDEDDLPSGNHDSQPGDDGLTVVIEPRNAGEEFVPEAGDVSVVVLDPSKAGEAARVARWNFTATETRQKIAAGSAARGIRLQMPWPATPPCGAWSTRVPGAPSARGATRPGSPESPTRPSTSCGPG